MSPEEKDPKDATEEATPDATGAKPKPKRKPAAKKKPAAKRGARAKPKASA